ncbi:MAG: sulfatase activating formylglycine-generating enzyme [Akkermansiaceae bacterium]|jgi:formylglycine-generating enzyme required for sulfatase activity
MICPRPLPCLILSLCALLSSGCGRKPYSFLVQEETEPTAAEVAAAEALAAPIDTGGLNIIPGILPDKAVNFLPVTEQIFPKLENPTESDLKAYTETVPKAGGATIEMLPIPGGEFTIGTPETEADRSQDEGPQKAIKIEPFWMASTEITWKLYQSFMENGKNRNKDGSLDLDGNKLSPEPPLQSNPDLLDAISQPTPAYMPMHNSMGDNAGYDGKFPAVAMTQHAASKFCEWLTAQTGHYYRLPTEAEWEYACRAGTTTAYSFGDDVSKLGEYGWYFENSDGSYQPVGTKKPNPWGLYDMHGNASEWTIDAYLPDYSQHPEGTVNPFALTPKRYPRITRGGNWDSDPQDLRSGARLPSDKSWKNTDPQDPKSLWYHTDNWGLGFRIIRPAKNPTLEAMHLLWNTGPGERF